MLPDLRGEAIVAPVELPEIHDGAPCAWLMESGRFVVRFDDDRRDGIDAWIAEHGDAFRDFWTTCGGLT